MVIYPLAFHKIPEITGINFPVKQEDTMGVSCPPGAPGTCAAQATLITAQTDEDYTSESGKSVFDQFLRAEVDASFADCALEWIFHVHVEWHSFSLGYLS